MFLLPAGSYTSERFINLTLFPRGMNEPQDIERAKRARNRIRQNLQDIERKLDHLLLRIREVDTRIYTPRNNQEAEEDNE
jgi:prefoldin subunit 5